LVNNQRTHSLVQTKLQELGHPNTQVKFIQAPAPERPAGPASEPAATSATQSTTQRSHESHSSTPAAALPIAPPAPTPAPVARARVAPSSLSIEEFKNDPLIKAALEIFKGQIVEVRA